MAQQGTFEVRYNPYTPDVLPWLRQVVDDRAESVSVTSGVFTQDGDIGNSDVSVSAVFDEELPEYVKLVVRLDERELLNPASGPAVQDGLLRAVRWACDRYDVVFGHVSYRHAGEETELEYFLKGYDSDPATNTPRWRSHLRGYSWLMVVPDEIARVLGGADVLRASGAFHSVDVLPNGALLLQATPTFREYGDEAVANVHRVVQDVLISGEFRKPAPLDRPAADSHGCPARLNGGSSVGGGAEVLREVEALAAIRAAVGNRPYLVGWREESRIRQVLDDFGFQVLEIEVSVDTDLEVMISSLSEVLGFPNPPARSWYEFNDYFQDVERLGRSSIAILIRNADALLEGDLQGFVSAIYTLLSISEDIGPWSNSTVRVEYFFMSNWSSRAS